MSNGILVTGATGTVGGEVAKQLQAAGVDFVCGVRKPEGLSNLPARKLDFADQTTFAGALEGIGKLFLVAPPFTHDGAEGIFALIDQAAKAGVSHVVYLSVIGAETSPEGIHRRIEVAVENSQMALTSLRPNFFMQNFQTYEAPNLARGIIYLPTDEGRTSYVDVRDIAAVALQALTTKDQHHNKIYTLTGSEALTHGEIAGIFSKALGRGVQNVNPSAEQYVQTLAEYGMAKADIDTMAGLYSFVRQGWCEAVSPDIKEVLGRAPLTMADFARQVLVS